MIEPQYDISALAEMQSAIHAEAQVKKTVKHIGSFRHIPGLKIYSYNTTNGELKEVTTKRVSADIVFDKKQHPGVIRHFVAHEKGCLYVQALNIKNARRKLGLQ